MSVNWRSGAEVREESFTEALTGKIPAVSWAFTETKEARTREAKRATVIGFFISRGSCLNLARCAPSNLNTRKCPIVGVFLKPSTDYADFVNQSVQSVDKERHLL